jgi:acyl carrier protein
VEEEVARIWREVLGLEQLSVDDNFFDLGGHSLMATRVLARVQDLFKVELSLLKMFESPTIATMAANIAEAQASASAETPVPEIIRVSRESRRAKISSENPTRIEG